MSNVEVKESGKLEDKPALARMLDVLKEPFKGVIVLVRGKDRKSFVFDQRKPMLSSSLLQEGSLGKTLLEKNMVTGEQFQKIKEQEATGKSFFQSAVEILSMDQVQETVLETWMGDLATVFSWDIGQFASVEFLPKDVVQIDINRPLAYFFFRALIQKNLRRKSKLSPNARFEIESAQNDFVSPNDLFFSDTEKKIFETLGKSKSIKQLVQEFKLTEAEVAPVVFSLRDLSLVRADTDRRKPAVAAVPIPTQPISEDPKTQNEEFFTKIKKMDDLDFFQILGVAITASTKEVQERYFTLAKKYHPDRIKNLPGVNLKDAEKFFTKITEAYNTLINPQLRKEYEMSSSQQALKHEELMNKIIESESIYLEGKAFLNKNMFREAADKFRLAAVLYDQEPEYHVKLGWALFRSAIKGSDRAKIQEAKKILLDAHNKNYLVAEVNYYLGMIFKHENKLDQAKRYFLQCLQEDPGFAMASSELRALEKKIEVGKKR